MRRPWGLGCAATAPRPPDGSPPRMPAEPIQRASHAAVAMVDHLGWDRHVSGTRDVAPGLVETLNARRPTVGLATARSFA